MNIVTFCDVDDSIIDNSYTVEHFQSAGNGNADVAIIDINTIFDFEENKAGACKDKFVSIAIIDDDSDYDAFKNFGIDAWIKREELKDMNGLLNVVQKRCLS